MVVLPWIVGGIVSYCLYKKAQAAEQKADAAMQLVAQADTQNREWTKAQVLTTVREALIPPAPVSEVAEATA